MSGTANHASNKPSATTPSGARARQRIIDHGEVFTPPELVNDMLDLVAHECERIDSRFLEPACGNGNFLAEVLRRKLRTVDKDNKRNPGRWERDGILAVCSIYGIDLLPDNVAACRERLLGVLADAYAASFKEPLPEPVARAAAFILSRNIVQGDALTLLAADGTPIVFSEWSPVNGTMLKRRDYKFAHLIGHAHIASTPLFSDLGEDVFLPEPVGERPPCHYLKVADTAGPGE
jgi:SAM-dependent methyltransferase